MYICNIDDSSSPCYCRFKASKQRPWNNSPTPRVKFVARTEQLDPPSTHGATNMW